MEFPDLEKLSSVSPRILSKSYPSEWTDPSPNYFYCWSLIYRGFATYVSYPAANYSYPSSFFEDLRTKADLPINLINEILVWAVILTIPLGNWLWMDDFNLKKFPESAWKTIFYLVSFIYSAWVTFFSGRYNIFQDPLNMWQDFRIKMPVQADIHRIFVIQGSFYLHSVYASLFMDHKRKDTLVMLFHHCLTLCLLGMSYAVRYHKIGILVVALHDITDVCLEFTKCNVYLKRRKGKYYPFNDHLSTIGFLSFAGSWYWNRLYLYPLRVLYGAAWGPLVSAPSFPMSFYVFFNVLLFVLQLLNIYWFLFVLLFLWKIATGQMKEVDDVREHECDEGPAVTADDNTSTPLQNGVGLNAVNGPSLHKRHFENKKLS